MKLKNLKKVPMEVASLLAAEPNIVQLIYNDQPSALTHPKEIKVGVQDLINSNYIGFYPATESGIKDVDRNTFIIINLEDFNLQHTDNNVGATGAIYITTDKAHCLLDGNRLRLLELADSIESCLEGQKLSSAGKITLSSINYVVFSDFRSGYRINFRLNDQQARKAEL